MRIKTPCPRCGKRKKIRTFCELTPDHLRVTVRNGCYSCGWRPPRKYFILDRKPAANFGPVAQLIRAPVA